MQFVGIYNLMSSLFSIEFLQAREIECFFFVCERFVCTWFLFNFFVSWLIEWQIISNNRMTSFINDSSYEAIKSKHPPPADLNEKVMIKSEVPFADPILFENIDDETILKAALRTKGAAGPSGLDADGWRRILVSKNYGKRGNDLRSSIVIMTRKLCCERIDIDSNTNSTSIEAYIACRLIPLDKNPGVRPIGIGEVLRRIIGKAIISVIKPEIIDSAGSLQLCAGQQSGCEAAVQAFSSIFEEEETDAILFVDTSNAFNSINRKIMLHNIQYLCPPMSIYSWNCYCTPSRLFVSGGLEISSAEGTTQGDTMAMPMYAIGITPLLKLLKKPPDPHNADANQSEYENNTKHAAFADDLGGAGKLVEVRQWWDNVRHYGPMLGYYPNPSKSWLVVKDEEYNSATEIFQGTGVNITTSGRKYLGGFIGKVDERRKYVKTIIDDWIEKIKLLSNIAKSEPQAAYAAFVSGFKHKFTYHIRVIPDISDLLKYVDDIIDTQFIPAITDGHYCSPDERLLLALPVKMGGVTSENAKRIEMSK